MVHALPATVPASPAPGVCATCGQVGKRVAGHTVKALLVVRLRAVHTTEYLFCGTATCAIVYFAVDGTQTFTTEQVREHVYQKEPDAADVWVCYCFRHTVGEIHAAPAHAPRYAAGGHDISTSVTLRYSSKHAPVSVCSSVMYRVWPPSCTLRSTV